VADLVGTFHDSSLAELNVGRTILELARRATDSGLRARAGIIAAFGRNSINPRGVALPAA
jgi:hypothetical protein